MSNKGILYPKTKKRLDYVTSHYGTMPRKAMAEALNCDIENVDYIIKRFIKPGKIKQLEENIVINQTAKRFMYDLLVLDKTVKQKKINTTTADIISGLISHIHEESQVATGKTQYRDNIRQSEAHFKRKRAQGLCVRCSQPVSAGRSTWYCEKHLEQARLYQKKRQEGLKLGAISNLSSPVATIDTNFSGSDLVSSVGTGI